MSGAMDRGEEGENICSAAPIPIPHERGSQLAGGCRPEMSNGRVEVRSGCCPNSVAWHMGPQRRPHRPAPDPAPAGAARDSTRPSRVSAIGSSEGRAQLGPASMQSPSRPSGLHDGPRLPCLCATARDMGWSHGDTTLWWAPWESRARTYSEGWPLATVLGNLKLMGKS